MPNGNQASAPGDDFDKAIASLRDLVASAQRDSQAGPAGEAVEDKAASASEADGAQSGGFNAQASAASGPRPEGLAAQARPGRLTDVLSSGIHEVTQEVIELIDANRAAHSHLFGPLSLPPRPGASRPTSTATADGHLAAAMWQLRESINELQAVSHALLSRI